MLLNEPTDSSCFLPAFAPKKAATPLSSPAWQALSRHPFTWRYPGMRDGDGVPSMGCCPSVSSGHLYPSVLIQKQDGRPV